MSTVSDDLQRLLDLSHHVGHPDLDAAILGEGNTSLRRDGDTFLVKASGSHLGTMTPADVVALRFAPILDLLARSDADESVLQAAFAAAQVDPACRRRPSVEALMHAALLQDPTITCIAHTHPTAINAITCSSLWPAALAGRLFPDEAVVLGPGSVLVPYVDPGVPLAKAICTAVDDYRVGMGVTPKVVYLQNHGVIALGRNPTEALNITTMAIKAARLRLGAIQAGADLRPLDDATIAHLLGRPDERYRQAALTGR
jgi:rhamnose utilization protein RhaD (predicted bifunctional aldolase and dehydrogenase)